MLSWDEIRTAYQVARHGTVSGAASALGVHHSTVIRHVDALEAALGVRLFQRHARGYTPTEAGEDLARVAQSLEDQIAQLENRLKGRGSDVAGDLVLTSLESLAPDLAPVLVAFQRRHPSVRLRYIVGPRLFRLEHGEAHVAIRAGRAPDHPDNVVQPFARMHMTLFASEAYVREHGMPEGESALPQHRFVTLEAARDRPAPYARWLAELVPEEAISLTVNDLRGLEDAIAAGAGIGFLPLHAAERRPGLVQVLPPREEWHADLWLVTHVDLHRTAKVQALVQHLKAHAREWAQ